ncbi:hypothetical protein [Saccharothrix hoggarensis]|uniref:Uncharacterized protein n=1 Tax=Saccharothrix hoggarensis TaxID=913853 RepID=A0ABW3QUI0_9PSEU
MTNRYTGTIEAEHGCFLLQADDLPQTGAAGQYGALIVDPGSGQVELLTKCDDGPVHLTVEVHDSPAPPPPRAWAATATATVRWEGVATESGQQLTVGARSFTERFRGGIRRPTETDRATTTATRLHG